MAWRAGGEGQTQIGDQDSDIAEGRGGGTLGEFRPLGRLGNDPEAKISADTCGLNVV